MPWSLTVPSSSTGASPLSEADPEADPDSDPEADPDSDPDSRTSAPSSSPHEATTSAAGNSRTAIFRMDSDTTRGGDRIFGAPQTSRVPPHGNLLPAPAACRPQHGVGDVRGPRPVGERRQPIHSRRAAESDCPVRVGDERVEAVLVALRVARGQDRLRPG